MAEKHNYTVEEIKVSDLEVDPRVQRFNLQAAKVDRIVRNYNRDARGIVTVSRRRTEGGAILGNYLIDGWHRTEVERRVTENTGTMTCHVYEGLTLAEEAQMFLDLNYANQPSPLEKHAARVIAGDAQALRVQEAVHTYHWRVSPSPEPGNVQAIAKLYNLDDLSMRIEAEPHLIQQIFLVITRAWGTDRFGSQAVILEGMGRFLAQHGSKVNVARLIERLASYKGGPQTLHAEATQYANLAKGRVSMAVAHLITVAYNKGLRGESLLPAWTGR